MTNCKYNPNRIVPISFNQNETFKNVKKDYFFLCQITRGYVVMLINGEKHHLSSNSLLSFPRNTKIEILALYQLKAHSVSFALEFINVNLNWDCIESVDYPLIYKVFDYPCFDLFYQHNMIYDSFLPLNTQLNDKINKIFQDIFVQLHGQPDNKWSCRTRFNILALFEIAEHFCHEFMQGDKNSFVLEEKVLDYIHLNLCSEIRIVKLCELFKTNHTTISKKFKALTGFSIADYIIEKRIFLAKHSLAFTFLSIEEISEKCGFSEISYFTKLFKKRVGITPLKYRHEMIEKRSGKNGLY